MIVGQSGHRARLGGDVSVIVYALAMRWERVSVVTTGMLYFVSENENNISAKSHAMHCELSVVVVRSRGLINLQCNEKCEQSQDKSWPKKIYGESHTAANFFIWHFPIYINIYIFSRCGVACLMYVRQSAARSSCLRCVFDFVCTIGSCCPNNRTV